MAPKIATEHLALISLALGGCRAVIGIEDLHPADASITSDGGALDASDGSSGNDGGSGNDAGDGAIDGAKPDLTTCATQCRTDGGFA
jgi:hypothetical protein